MNTRAPPTTDHIIFPFIVFAPFLSVYFLVLGLLTLKPLYLLTPAVELRLLSADLLILLLVLNLLPLNLIANQTSGRQSQAASDQRAGGRSPDRGTDDTAGRGAETRAHKRSLFSAAERTAGASRGDRPKKRRSDRDLREFSRRHFSCPPSSFVVRYI